MIYVKNLIFEYPGVRALDNVSIEIPKGQISALVGPNGAGKTTLMRCIAALETPVSGSIKLDNLSVFDNPRESHRKMGYLADFFGLYKTLSVNQCLTYFARAHSIAANEVANAVEKAALRLGLENRLDQLAGSLSRGLAQRLAIAQAIIHEPELIILDEPASGLDPGARHSLSELFLALKAQGMTLVISSHILSELEEYSDHMIIVNNGKIIQHRDLQNQNSDQVLIKLTLAHEFPALEQILAQIPEIEKLNKINQLEYKFKYLVQPEKHHTLIKHLIEKQVPLSGFSKERSNLQDTYLEKLKHQSDSVNKGN